jgi:hypothetical protein
VPNRRTVTVTNPSATRLPRKLGTSVMSPATPEPIRPRTIPKHRQMKAAPSVVYTSAKASRESLRGGS